MAVQFNPFTGNLDIVGAGASANPGGSDTQVQFNDGGSFGGSADLTWDDTGKVLGVGGDVDLDDGGTYTTTLQTITATANRTISFPDATGTVALVAGSSGQLLYNSAGANAGTPTLTYDGSILTSTGRFINSYNAAGIASAPAKSFTGTWFSGGTATTTKPHVLIEPAGTTSGAWSTSGTGLGINAASGFAGNLLDLQVNGVSSLSASQNKIEGTYNGTTCYGIYANSVDSTFRLFRPGSGGLQIYAKENTFYLGLASSYGGAATQYITAFTANKSIRFGDGQTLFTIQGPGSNGAQTTFTLSGGDPNSDRAVDGHNLLIRGGNGSTASGTDRNGGHVYIRGGDLKGAGLNGNVYVGDSQTKQVIVGGSTTQMGFYGAAPVDQPAAVSDLTTTFTTNPVTADGSVTIADGSAPTVAEVLEYCVELEAKLEAALGHLRTLGLIAT